MQSVCSLKTEYRNKNLKVSNVCKREDKQDIRGCVERHTKQRKDLYRKMKANLSIITLDEKGQVKRIRAQGGCLGTKSRRKT